MDIIIKDIYVMTQLTNIFSPNLLLFSIFSLFPLAYLMYVASFLQQARLIQDSDTNF